jgi:hypothetical protein
MSGTRYPLGFDSFQISHPASFDISHTFGDGFDVPGFRFNITSQSALEMVLTIAISGHAVYIDG